MNEVGKSALRPLGITEQFLTTKRVSMYLVGKYGCGHIAGVFSPQREGPSKLHIQITGK